jgi:thioredoxin 1
MLCIGGICIPYSVFWPLLVLMLQPIWDIFRKIFGLKKVTKNESEGKCCSEVKNKADGIPSELSSEAEFNQLINSNSIVIVRFTAPWCKPCKEIEPVFMEMAKQHIDKIFLSIDVDKFDEIAAKYSAIKIPLFLVFQKSEIIEKYVGSNPDNLKKLISKY